MQKINFVNFLKIRGGYGVSGNQTNRYASLARVGSNTSYVFGDGGSTVYGQQVSSLENPNLKWERTIGMNIGADFTVLNNRLTGNIDLYNNNTYDLLFNVAIPAMTGFNQISTNLGQINNKGFELSLSYKVIDRKDFKWTSTLNVWANKNKIVTLTGVDADKNGVEDDLVSSGLFIGKPIKQIFDYKADGIYQLTDTRLPGFQIGSLRVVDQNGDGVINGSDRTFLGNQDPLYKFSFLNSVTYKSFTLSAFINSIQGGNDGFLGNNMRIYFRDDNAVRNNELNAVDYWSPRNPNGTFPRIISGSHSTVEPNLYQSRTFIRLQDVSLSYAMPAKIISKLKAQAVNVYVSGKNLATWTNWKGWDPETGQGLLLDGRPVLKAITVGVHVTY